MKMPGVRYSKTEIAAMLGRATILTAEECEALAIMLDKLCFREKEKVVDVITLISMGHK